MVRKLCDRGIDLADPRNVLLKQQIVGTLGLNS